MANSPQSIKRARQAIKRTQRNANLRAKMRTYLKKAYTTSSATSLSNNQDVETSQKTFLATVSLLDNMVTKGIIHKNKAARHKRRLNKRLKLIAQST